MSRVFAIHVGDLDCTSGFTLGPTGIFKSEPAMEVLSLPPSTFEKK